MANGKTVIRILADGLWFIANGKTVICF